MQIVGFRGRISIPLSNAFVAKLDPSLSGAASLLYSTYLGGNFQDLGYGITVDPSGNAYVTGLTESTDFPTLNAYQSTLKGTANVFVTKLGAAATIPILTAAPASLNFGKVYATATSRAKKLTLTNKGAAVAEIRQVIARAPFIIAGGTDTCTGQAIEPKKKCSFKVEFAPTAVAKITDGTVNVAYNGISPKVTLTGDGIAVVLEAPKSVSLGRTAAGAAGRPKAIEISNSSTVAVTLGAATLGGTDPGSFEIVNDQCSGKLLAAKGKCAMETKFAPPAGSASGKQGATLSLGFTYGPNNGSTPAISLSGKVK